MEWIYTLTKVSGEGSFELAQKTERFLACTVLMDDLGLARMHNLLEILILTNFTKLPVFLGICNLLCIWSIRAIPIYNLPTQITSPVLILNYKSNKIDNTKIAKSILVHSSNGRI